MGMARVDVAIVGYGPIAKMLAVALGEKGWKVEVFEKYNEPYKLPRAVAMDHEIARVLQQAVPTVKLEKQLEKAGGELYQWLNAERKTLLNIPFVQDGISGWPGELFFHQPTLEKAMDETVQRFENIQVHFGNEVVQLDEQEDFVELHIKEHTGNERKIRASFVVGADGANSFVREQMPYTITDLKFTYHFLVVDIKPNEKSDLPVAMQICDPKRPTTVVSGGPGRRRWEFMLLPGETKEDAIKEENIWNLVKPWNMTPENAVLERSAVYTFEALWVDEWREGRLILAGDAAHLTPPFMGQGMCSGIRDTVNLAWKLDLVLQGKASAELLDTYTEERKPHNERVVHAALYLGDMICVTDLMKAKERDEAFFTGKVPPFPPFPILEDGIIHDQDIDSLAGSLSPQDLVEYKGKRGLFDDVVGRGWMLISYNRNAEPFLNDVQKNFLHELGVTCIEITKEDRVDAVKELTDKYANFFNEHEVEAVIVRPDYYIFGSVENISEVPDLVNDLAKQFKKYMNVVTAE